jgi:hypothetical protein
MRKTADISLAKDARNRAYSFGTKRSALAILQLVLL